MSNYGIFEFNFDTKNMKQVINLDNDLNGSTLHPKIVKKVLCIFTDENNKPISLSKDTTIKFHTLIDLHDSHFHYRHNYHLGKKKHFFTDLKHEEEGIKKNDYLWILDFGWMNELEKKSNHMEFSFHFVKKRKMKLTTLVLYEDRESFDYEFGWLLDKLNQIKMTENDIINNFILQNI